MQVFQKVVDEAGNETFVEVDLKEVELPEDHPIQQKLNAVKQESIARRNQIKDLKQRLAALEGDGGTSEPEQPSEQPQQQQQQQVTALDMEAVARTAAELAAQKLREQEAAEARAQQERKAEIDKILNDTGLSEMYRTVLEAIPDLNVAKEKAEYLAKSGLVFDNTPSEGNGKRDVTSLLAKASKKLGLPEGDIE